MFAAKVRPTPTAGPLSDAEATALFRTMPAPFGGVMEAVDAGGGAMFNMTITVAVLPARVGMPMRRLHRVSGAGMRGTAFDAEGNEGETDTYVRRTERSSSDLAGAWELVSSEWDGLMLTTDSGYLYIVTRHDRPQITGRVRDISDADAAELYRAFDAQAGTYAVDGSTLTRRPQIARDPRMQRRELAFEHTLADGLLTTHLDENEMRWRKRE